MGKSKRRQISFRQFDVSDDRCAMKVGTDGLLLGAWSGSEHPIHSIIDVGTGSGLVALMLAQRHTEARVIAVELDPAAASQAQENFENSPFNDRIRLICEDFFSWSQHVTERSDMVVCNPPFFRDKPKSPDSARNLARHDDHLPIERLMEVAYELTKAHGVLCLVWPMERFADLMHAAKQVGWKETQRVEIHGTPGQPVERILSRFMKDNAAPLSIDHLTIEIQPFEPGVVPDNTPAFKNLLSQFIKRFD